VAAADPPAVREVKRASVARQVVAARAVRPRARAARLAVRVVRLAVRAVPAKAGAAAAPAPVTQAVPLPISR
jgi:hypothetical protein